MQKLVCFSGVEAPGGFIEHEGYRTFWAIVDGSLRQVNVMLHKDLIGRPGYSVWPGVYNCTFNEKGFITDVKVSDAIITGYSVNAPENGTIVLGVEETKYGFIPSAPVYGVENRSIIQNYKTRIEELVTDWNDNYFLKLSPEGLIEEMYIFVQGGTGTSPQLDEIKKFKAYQGALEYTYYQPPAKPGVKYPVFVWFHGLHGGTSTWTSHFEYNPIANWANESFQSQFSAGGAYIMVPRAYEDLREGHGISWDQWQVELFMSTIDEFLSLHPDADPNRIYIGGYSMGGRMTWLVITSYPEKFAAAVPCASPGKEAEGELLERMAKLPVWAIHGAGDFSPAETVTKPMQALMSRNPKSRMLLLEKGFRFPDGTPTFHDHLSWIPALNNLKYNDGTLYSDRDGKQVESSLIEWLNIV
jgi:pimeloyl-ACP methyl ester carboxylesterase